MILTVEEFWAKLFSPDLELYYELSTWWGSAVSTSWYPPPTEERLQFYQWKTGIIEELSGRALWDSSVIEHYGIAQW